MINIEQGALRTLKQDGLVLCDGQIEQSRRIDDMALQPLSVPHVLIEHFIDLEGLDFVEPFQKPIHFDEIFFQLFSEQQRIQQVAHADAGDCPRRIVADEMHLAGLPHACVPEQHLHAAAIVMQEALTPGEYPAPLRIPGLDPRARYREDPVRILRVARFAARFASLGFSVAPETLALMRAMVAGGEVNALVPERVWQELSRGLMEARPSRMFDVLRDCGALARIFPELDALWGVPQPEAHHPEVDTGIHTMLVVDYAASQGWNLATRWAAR